ncbi:TPA: bifunctional diguanylate cyclase/phosphodiesterase [Vibrio harveyi]|uniref:putative bifunctional diguanylate cyclase/phosphodiesterase n=1 Tax=Vibrio harveyi TaxID=669 RepID=UPI00237FDB1B|nr:bifunctional diguanylate cyclase/phosphodiesterase [Vibrio harveyi]ELE7130939.1 bifunctional diguanylate cyclase/phosphodiesterase [Vibrio harveyi]HDM8171559.1 bifunctional diguanylate cyclase/phosphodiesterase [Vibrio harveyi]
MTRNICSKTDVPGWIVLLILITGFIFAYAAFLNEIIHKPAASLLETGVALLLLGGSIFIVLMIKWSNDSILELHEIAEREKHNAVHDSLTGLPNRKYCLESIDNRVQQGIPFSVILFDVVNFKQINDAMGHFCGDQLLIQIGQRLQEELAGEDRLFRVGGDEFVILTSCACDHTGTELIEKLDHAMAQRFHLDEFQVSSRVVFGLSTYPSDAESNDLLIKFADIAMYHAKHNGQLMAFYNEDMNVGAKYQLEISSRIQCALDKEEFQLYYQPLIDARSNLAVGFEAVIRWRDSNGKNISPNDFIPIAERSNQVHSITMWVLNQVEKDLHTMSEQGINLPVHVNLSAKDLSSNRLFSRLDKMLSDNPHFADMISLEITETMAIDRVRELNPLIHQIKGLGIKISLDDFGTGYSSLSLLRDLPVDQIKIDRSFLCTASKTEGTRSIVENTIALAHGLGYSVVAEGVQDMDTLHFLRSRGCDIIQGYLFCPALPLNEVISWVNTHDEEQSRIRRA